MGNLKTRIGYFLSFGVLLCLIYALCSYDNYPKQSIRITVACLGGLMGWITGIIVSPQEISEKSQFRRISKTISAFVSGFLLAKLDRLWDKSLANQSFSGEVVLSNLLFFSCFFCLGLLLVFVGRKYLNEN